jgi:hypothetical protein
VLNQSSAREVAEGRCPVGPDHDPGGIQPPVRDPQGVEPPGVGPDAPQELVVDLAGIERGQRAATGLGHEQGVALGRHPGRHHREHRDAGPLGQQRHERLVLDLLPAAQRQVGVSPRYHSEDQTEASSWPSQASRP